MLITEEYRQLNKTLHEGNGWGKGGIQFVDDIEDFADSIGAETILDYGCGKGALVDALKNKGFSTHGYDPVTNDSFMPMDLVASTDVLEHIEPELLDNVLRHIATLATKGVYLVISLRKAVKILPDGRNAHLIVESKEWWEERLSKYFPEPIISTTHGGGAGTLVYVWVQD